MKHQFVRSAACIAAILAVATIAAKAQQAPAAPAAPKPGYPLTDAAKKQFDDAASWEKRGDWRVALDEYRKANKQDGGHCVECLSRSYAISIEHADFKQAEQIAHEWLDGSSSDVEKANAHFRLAAALQKQGIAEKKQSCFQESSDEFKAALSSYPKFTLARFFNGISLAYLRQDDAARAEFSAFLSEDQHSASLHERAQRYVQNVELARARMAPPFAIKTLDGRTLSLDSLAGKVVLIDFWATWCGPCREALPHIAKIAKNFDGRPLVVLSVSLDRDEAKWKDFVEKNNMTWLQYRDGSFDGRLSQLFSINAIPSTFTIDVDGVIEDQHVGDEGIDGKIKKLVEKAEANNTAKSAAKS